ncbi:tetratricopeptide repeat protein [Dapis sp. BLCC M229]|uniref:tetratricopeptide repeat protein n=1 Tax=Dapis sp. BLCC M229 TaxID=3400188 RepID=UPI003CF91876
MSDIENQETAAFNFKQKAEIYLSQGKLDEAYANCSKALEMLPNSGEIYKILGNIWQRRGQLESAKKSYNQAIEYNPNLAEVHANLGSISARQKQWEQAVKYYEKAISIKPDFAGFYRNLAKIWECLGKDKLVIECTYQALILEPTLATATEWLNLGDKLLKLGKLEEAIACYKQAIKSDKKLSAGYNKLGNTLTNKGELDRAIAVYKQGIKIRPDNSILHYNLGEALTQKQQYQEATIAYNHAIELNPSNYMFHEKLECSLQKKYNLKETEEINFNQANKTINFTIIPGYAGFTDQLLQFMMFYKLGLSLGWKYIHTNFSSNRSSQKVYDFLGFNQYWSANIKDAGLSNYSLIYLRFDDRNLSDLKAINSLNELQKYCNNLLDKYNFTKNDIMAIFRLGGLSKARSKILSLVNSEIPDYQDNLNFRKIYFEHSQDTVNVKKVFDPQKIKLLIHIRAGDIAHIKTPWGLIKSIKRMQDESRKFDKDFNRINCFVNQVNSLDVDDYYQFTQEFIYCLGKQNISIGIFSDGYKRAFDFIQKNVQQMKLTTEEILEIFQLSNSYESEQFRRFNNLENCTCIIGENDEKLFDLIRSCMMADIFIIGCEQRMIPKFLANYYDLERQALIFLLYRNRDLSSIMKTHFQDLRLDSRKVTMIPVNLDNYQINDLVSIVKNKINFIESSSLMGNR